MKAPLTAEQRQALDQHPDGIEVEDEQTQKMYVLIEADLYERAMQSLRRQEDLAAIQAGNDDMEAGRVMPLDEADKLIRQKLGFPPRKS